MLKVAYISPTFFSNVDIPFIQEVKKYCSVFYFAIVPFDGKGYAINIKNLPKKGGIYPATDFPEIQRFEQMIDLNKTFVVYFPKRSAFAPSRFFISIMLIFKLLRLKFDVYHFTEPLYFGEWPLYCLRRKAVFDVHDPFIHSSDASKLMRIYRFMSFHLFKRFILFNTTQRDAFINNYHLSEQQVFSSALSSYTYLRIYPQQTAPSYKYLLFTGTIRSHKGLEYLMEAMTYVHKKHPDYKLVIAGAGPFYFDISQYTDKDYYVIINKFLDDEEQVPLLAHAECVVCPYVDATQSGVVMSAYAFAKPCIVTDVGGLKEMVGNGRYGMVVPSRDANALADAVCKMIEHPEMQQQFSHNIQEDYDEGAKSWKKVAKDIYDDVYTKFL